MGSDWWARNRYCEKRCFAAGSSYGINCSSDGDYREDHVCGYEEELVPFNEAEKNCKAIGMNVCDRETSSSKCGYNSETAKVWTLETCSVNISVDSDGKVASYHSDKTKMNKVSVNWDNGPLDVKNCPSTCTSLTDSCLCPLQIEIQAVFDRVPAATELSELKVGAFKPSTACASCGEVKAYFTESIDASTIFEYQGKYFRNMRSVVVVGDKSFRNPPVIGADVEHTARSATQEIEALLEHLVYHPNTAPFISHRLIQRFVTSSPSTAYVQSVATAFRTGRFGRSYSGEYGDLGATMAAILLHPEARASQDAGALREPLVKVVHFLRAMEFEDASRRDLLFQLFQDRIGQEPFASPTVFNFYMPDYELPSGHIAPEFQILDSASLVNFLNGMFSLIDYQGVTDCKYGFGVKVDRCDAMDSLKLTLSNNSTEALNDLDLLLTGSRLTSHAREAVMTYTQNTQNGDVKAIQEAMVLTPEFNTLGAPKPVGPRAPETQTVPKGPPRSYKAVVNLYLGGGADTFNLLVPINCALHDEYMAVRGEAALGNTKLLEISSSQACSSFGLHYKLPKLKQLYQAGEAAFVSNIGALVQPLTKYEYKSGTKSTCVGLFSHSDQTAAAQTLKCQVAGASPKGVGGRMADVLAAGSQKFSTSSFSLKGKKTWSEGFSVIQQSVDGSGDIRTLENYDARRPLIANITKEELGNIYSEEFSKNLGKMVDSAEILAGQLGNVTLSSTWPETEDWTFLGLLRQFQAVSKLIASSQTRQVEREFFYVELGGFDTHNEFEKVDELFAFIDDSLDAFVKELKAQGVFDSVVLVTTSDFGRTLTSNGKGTDHGWAGNHFVVGGKVKGGEIYNEFPSSLLEGNLYDVGRGRMIPRYPWESVMLPIAEWMGVDAMDRSTVFPNLHHFNSSLLLATSSLFST